VTSRIESAHALIKRFLENSTGDLLTTWLGIKKAVVHQINQIRGQAAILHTKVPLHVDRQVYNQVYGLVTILALRLVEKQRIVMMSLPPQPCTGTFTTTMGLPCIHRYNQAKESNTGLTIDDFHQHWYWIQPKKKPTHPPTN
jgi:hypothetical protein